MELVIDRLTKQYKNKIVVDRVSTTLTRGVHGLLGANGAGKTTLMRMLCGVLKPTSGEAAWDGIDVEQEAYRDALGYLPQDFGYYPEFTAYDFLMYLASLKGLTKQGAKARIGELLELVSLTECARKKIRTFSGGMKQRLGIAQAMLNDPKILILDEPTAGLDPKERIRFRNLISHLGTDRIVLLSTHIVSDIESIASNILLMKDGQLIHTGSPKELIEVMDNRVFDCDVDPKTAASLMKEYPVINIREERDQVYLRLVSEGGRPPCEGALPAKASLEDLYLFYFSEGGRENEPLF